MPYQFRVHPKFRRSGVGRLLVEGAVDWARRSKATEMVLSVALGPGSDALQQGMRRKLESPESSRSRSA